MSKTLLRQWVASCSRTFFCDINNLLSYHFNTQLALDILPIYTIIDMIETAG